ncbi:MAG: transposase [Cyclobacteriaceae bacterium]
MKRYVKTYKSKWQNQYTEEFKRSVCEEFLAGGMTLRAVERKHGLGNSRLNDWLNKYGYSVRKPYLIEGRDMAKKKSKKSTDDTIRIKELEKQLAMARLEATAYRKMIEIAEDELKIEIRKKSDTEQ